MVYKVLFMIYSGNAEGKIEVKLLSDICTDFFLKRTQENPHRMKWEYLWCPDTAGILPAKSLSHKYVVMKTLHVVGHADIERITKVKMFTGIGRLLLPRHYRGYVLLLLYRRCEIRRDMSSRRGISAYYIVIDYIAHCY